MLLLTIDFAIIWRYFAWSNQTLATVVLWTITVYLASNRKNYWITLIPSLFMTAVVTTYLFLAPEGFNLSITVSYLIGGCVTLSACALFVIYYLKISRKELSVTLK